MGPQNPWMRAVAGDKAGPECGIDDVVREYRHILLNRSITLLKFGLDAVDTRMTRPLYSDSTGHRAT